MTVEEIVLRILLAGVLVGVYLAFVAYFVAAYGMLNDTRFGRAVFYMAIPLSTFAGAMHIFAPDVLRDLDISTPALVLGTLGVSVVAGLIGAVGDAMAWLRGDDVQPRRPFET